ncbi:MAG TPA: carboxypeptidase regulatory-like domain-containing protein [Armatimonadota bacterium]|jgi:hypothetical protein
MTSDGGIAGEVYFQRLPAKPSQSSPHALVRGAQVTVEGTSFKAITDESGQFSLPQIPPGSYDLTVAQEQFRQPTHVRVVVQPGQNTTVSVPMGEVYYLGIGVAAYQDTKVERLEVPPREARALVDILSRGLAGDVTLLTDAQATKRNIRDTLLRIAAQLRPDDFLVIYFSGHAGRDLARPRGSLDRYYLQPVDSDTDDPDSDIYAGDLVNWLAKAPDPRHIVLMMDSCHAAGIATAIRTLQKDGRHYTILAASAAEESSIDTRDGGVFTSSIIRGLTNARKQVDTNHDHQITARELYTYTAPRTTKTAGALGETQHPQLSTDDDPALLRY